MRRFGKSLSIFVSTLLLSSLGFAQQAPTISVPSLVRYDGTLKDAQGSAISSVTVGMTFAIYRQQDGGAPVWIETQNITTDAAGGYSALLGSTTATGLPSDLFSQVEQRWLGVRVQGQEEQPRVQLVSVPYALKAHEAETLGGKSVSDFVLSTPLNLNAISAGSLSTGSVSAGNSPVTKPPNLLPSQGPTTFSGSTSNQIVKVTQSGTGAGVNATAASKAVLGTATAASGLAYGVEGVASGTSGIGVLGSATSLTGSTEGVKGSSSSTSGSGVRGDATATSGRTYGVQGNDASPNGAGVIGTNTAAGGYGVYGKATNQGAGAGTGVVGVSAGPQGIGVAGAGQMYGVSGLATNGTDGTAGLYGNSSGVTGKTAGVFGQAASADGAGGVFQNSSGVPGAKILVAEDSQTPRFSVDNTGSISVSVGAIQPVTVSLPVNHARQSVSGNGLSSFTLDWAFPFSDTNYTATCIAQVQGGWHGDGPIIAVTSLDTATVTVEVNISSLDQMVIHCLGVHD
jgi:trimeric autotransporter adhesin